jgi:3'-5' exoribonuclease
MKTVAELEDGEHVYGQFLVTDVKKGVTSNSKNYLTIVFQDATGSIEAKLWDYAPEDLATFVTGNIVNLEAEVLLYNQKLQLKVIQGREDLERQHRLRPVRPGGSGPKKGFGSETRPLFSLLQERGCEQTHQLSREEIPGHLRRLARRGP